MDRTLDFAARLVGEVLPEIFRWRGIRAVLKYSGKVTGSDAAQELDGIASNIVLLQAVGVLPVIVHGGGSDISAAQKRLGITPAFVQGLRVYDDQTMDAATEVLLGISENITRAIGRRGGRAAILGGSSYGGWLRATRHEPVRNAAGELVDLGRVAGRITADATPIIDLHKADIIPVIPPLAVDDAYASLCGNADHVAAAIVEAIKASKVVYLTDVDGIRDDTGEVAERVTVATLSALIEEGVVTGGMVPKSEGLIACVRAGASEATIMNGKVPHALIVEFLTRRGLGTMVVP